MATRQTFMISPLTGIRGLAALAVIVVHFYAHTGVKQHGFHMGVLQPIALHGWMGVDLFFILSGFVMALVHQKDFVEFSWQKCQKYWYLRFARVYPLHAFLMIIFLIAVVVKSYLQRYGLNGQHLPLLFTQWMPTQAEYTTGHFWASLLLVQIWSPTQSWFNPASWSVAAEALAYLWFPVLAYLSLRVNKLKWNWLILIAFWLAFRIFDAFAPVESWLPSIYNNPHGINEAFRIAERFGVGCILFNIYKQAKNVNAKWFDSLGILSLISIYALMATNAYKEIIVVAMALLIYCLAQPGPLLTKLLGNRAAVYLGEISYAIYLCHGLFTMAVAQVLTKLPQTGATHWVVFCIYVLSICLFSHCLYTYIEKPARNWLRERHLKKLHALNLATACINK